MSDIDKAEDIDQLIYRELPPDRYCYIHNFIVEKDKEIERLNNIIKEARELANKEDFTMKQKYEMRESILEILDKAGEE